MFFVFKQKTAYEMRISDWSSDVSSSDLLAMDRGDGPYPAASAQHGELFAIRHDAGDGLQEMGRDMRRMRRQKCSAPGRPCRPGAVCKIGRSAERRVGEECVSTCRYGW